jgi:hypothetical protein
MLGLGVVLTCVRFPMLFQGQEMLTYASFAFPSPPALDWSAAQAGPGLVQETADLVALR